MAMDPLLGRSGVSPTFEVGRQAQLVLAGLWLRTGNVEQAMTILGATQERYNGDGSPALIVDPGFVHYEGHHANSNVYFQRLTERLGMRAEVLRVIRSHPSFSNDETRSRPAFLVSPYERLFSEPLDAERLNAVNSLFASDFSRVMGRSRRELMIVHTARHTFVDGICQYLEGLGANAPSRLLLGVVEAEATQTGSPMHDAVLSLYKRALSRLERLSNLEYLVLVETEHVACFLRSAGCHESKVVVAPYVAAGLDEMRSAKKAPKAQVVRIGYMGQSRPERGAMLIPAIARKVLESSPDNVVWRAQLNVNWAKARGGTEVATTCDWLEHHPRFELIPACLPVFEYYQALSSIDVMVLPYGDRYNETGSGIAVESLMAGCVQVLPAGSSMHRMCVQSGAGCVALESIDVGSVVAGIQEAIVRLPELAAASDRAREVARSHDEFERIVEFCEGAVAGRRV
jgi:hypothetical protein